jgi:transposase
VFLDEVGFSLGLHRSHGWGKKGQPLREAVSGRRGRNLSVLGALCREGVVAFTGCEGAMTRADVEDFFAEELLPRLLPGSVLVMDNASIHKGGKIEALATAVGCRVLYLPAYSPDFNPIELVWAFVKGLVRKWRPTSEQDRLEAVEMALFAVTENLANACFRHCFQNMDIQYL